MICLGENSEGLGLNRGLTALNKRFDDTEELGLLLLLLSRFSRVRLCATPWTAAHQAPPSLGFSRQEHWSGLPFPSPMHLSLELLIFMHSISHAEKEPVRLTSVL